MTIAACYVRLLPARLEAALVGAHHVGALEVAWLPPMLFCLVAMGLCELHGLRHINIVLVYVSLRLWPWVQQ